MEIDFKFNVCNKSRFTAWRVITRAPALLLIPVRESPVYQKRFLSCRESQLLNRGISPVARDVDNLVAAVFVTSFPHICRRGFRSIGAHPSLVVQFATTTLLITSETSGNCCTFQCCHALHF